MTPPPIAMAGIAQKMVNILHFNCPANYQCGGPAEAAHSSMDAILHLMGVGVAMLQRKQHYDTSDWQRYVRDSAVAGEGVLEGFVQHKSQILSGALYAVLADTRRKDTRECEEVSEKALLSLLQWFCGKTGITKEDLLNKMDGTHDELIQMEKALP
jgi:hypothetical protein